VDESLLIKTGGAPDLDVLRAARWTQPRQMIFLGLPTDRELWRVFYRSSSRIAGVARRHTYSLACMPLTVAAIVNSVVPFDRGPR